MRGRAAFLLGAAALVALLLLSLGDQSEPRRAGRSAAPEPNEPIPVETRTVGVAADEPAYAVELLVQDEDQQPLDAVAIELLVFRGAKHAWTFTGRTARNGRLDVRLPLAGREDWKSIAVTVTKDGYATLSLSWKPRGERLRKTLTLARGGKITGRLVTPDGEPVAGGTIQVDPFISYASTDEEGYFTLWVDRSRLPVAVSAYASGFLSTSSRFVRALPGEIGDLVLERGLSITGIVRHASGAALPNLVLVARSVGNVGRARTRTRSDGTFAFEGLASGPWRIQLMRHAEGTPIAEQIVEAGGRDLDFRFEGVVYQLIVRDEEDRAFPQPSVAISASPELGRRGAQWLRERTSDRTVLAESGDRLMFFAQSEGYVPVQAVAGPPDRGFRQDVKLVLRRFEATAQLDVRLEGTSADTQGRLFVEVRTGPQGLRIGSRQGPGVVALPPGRWWVRVVPVGLQRFPFFVLRSVEVELEDRERKELAIPVQVGGRLRLRVQAAPSFMAGFKGSLTRLRDGKQFRLFEFRRANGSDAWATDVPVHAPVVAREIFEPGRYKVRITLPRHHPFEETIEIRELQFTDVRARLSRSN